MLRHYYNKIFIKSVCVLIRKTERKKKRAKAMLTISSGHQCLELLGLSGGVGPGSCSHGNLRSGSSPAEDKRKWSQQNRERSVPLLSLCVCVSIMNSCSVCCCLVLTHTHTVSFSLSRPPCYFLLHHVGSLVENKNNQKTRAAQTRTQPLNISICVELIFKGFF